MREMRHFNRLNAVINLHRQREELIHILLLERIRVILIERYRLRLHLEAGTHVGNVIDEFMNTTNRSFLAFTATPMHDEFHLILLHHEVHHHLHLEAHVVQIESVRTRREAVRIVAHEPSVSKFFCDEVILSK